MTIAARASALLLLSAVFVATPSPAAADPALLQDLTSVIMLLGKSCGQVVGAERLGDNDHLVTCKNGKHYRVFVNADGRVVAEKQ